MSRRRDAPPAVRVYTVCDESRYLIVRNVPALGCGDELQKLFATYGEVEECKPMDEEDCEQFTDVYWIKFHLVSNARFAKRKLDEFVFLGNHLLVSYAPQFESLSDTKDKLECRRKEVLAQLKTGRSKGPADHRQASVAEPSWPAASLHDNSVSLHMNFDQRWNYIESGHKSQERDSNRAKVSSGQDYFPSKSMNQTVQMIRQKLDKIQSTGKHMESEPAVKKARVDSRRRI